MTGNTQKIWPVLLCGGSGTRLWPLSRKAWPKQFLPVTGDYSSIQATALRVADSEHFEAPTVIAGEDYRFFVAHHLQEIDHPARRIILEPEGRNTCPAILASAIEMAAADPNAVMLVLPADHYIRNASLLVETAIAALPAANDGKLITFGVQPTVPHTGYGYIEVGAPLSTDGPACKAEQFVEKPNMHDAQRMLNEERWLWNAGIFMMKASALIEEASKLAAETLTACQAAIDQGQQDMDFLRLEKEAFARAPSDSIDYAIMEKSANVAVCPIALRWNDVGSWKSVHETMSHDQDGNAVLGDAHLFDTKDSLVRAPDHIVVTLGLENQVVVVDDNVVLVADMDRSEDIKKVVDSLKEKGVPEVTGGRLVHRPWGKFHSIAQGPRHQVKRLTVNPGQTLSLQRHEHRSEHWVVVKGQVRVTKDDEEFDLLTDQSTYIPVGCKHRLQNITDLPAELIEVQSGDYLGEDDIERFEDIYGRNSKD